MKCANRLKIGGRYRRVRFQDRRFQPLTHSSVSKYNLRGFLNIKPKALDC